MSAAASTNDLLYALQGLALARNLPIPTALVGVAIFLPFFDELRMDRALLLLQFIPCSEGNGNAPYHVTISGGRLGSGQSVDIEDASLTAALAHAILEYARRSWEFEW